MALKFVKYVANVNKPMVLNKLQICLPTGKRAENFADSKYEYLFPFVERKRKINYSSISINFLRKYGIQRKTQLCCRHHRASLI